VATMGDFEAAYEPELPRSVTNKRTAHIALWILGYFIAIWLLGFSYAVPLMIFAHIKFGGSEKWPISVFLTAAGWAFFYLLFEHALHIPFPEGLIVGWLA
ncbi:MAG: tripartite tricarboxylate transporter TctB family protein, partial [Candidatus Binatia bacterium]